MPITREGAHREGAAELKRQQWGSPIYGAGQVHPGTESCRKLPELCTSVCWCAQKEGPRAAPKSSTRQGCEKSLMGEPGALPSPETSLWLCSQKRLTCQPHSVRCHVPWLSGAIVAPCCLGLPVSPLSLSGSLCLPISFHPLFLSSCAPIPPQYLKNAPRDT